ncbi:hypothetical protein SAMN02746065_10462 [Desulfocicer vacuolatum DSM 3385]|uniref:Porin n=1 Tax=Desulfocicer vacuolatum DSM 3385 TaxID=1121400 RepID=A0A1W2A3K4_9BACT|nr:hypothetical protein [Desulfocicer vacuolatum]SMC55153.1 hypothetical protein SAMN02746065_10462 [Desulfocicer vacuolatum DSM 3385]
MPGRIKTSQLGLILCALIIYPWFTTHGETSPVFLSGYLKSTVTVQKFTPNMTQPPLEDDTQYVMIQSQLRMRLFHEPSDFCAFETSYAISPTAANPHLLASQGFISPRENSYRIHDFNETVLDTPPRDLSLFHNLDRLNINILFPSADLYLGRQAISFGSGKFINPTDIFSPFLFQDLNKENKIGVDALRLTFSTGDFSEIDLGLVFGKNGKMKNNAIFLRTRLHFYNTDISLMAMDFKNNLMLGFDMTRSISEAGFWLEAARVFAGRFENHLKEEDYFRLVSGIDFSFFDNTYIFVEYHYNSAGTNTKEKYISNTIGTGNPTGADTALKTAYADGGTYLLGRHYLIPGVTYEFTPLCSGTMHSLINLTDLSTYMGISLEYSLKQDIFLEAGGFWALGKRPDMYGPVVIPHSEFGLYSNMIYAGVRFYF